MPAAGDARRRIEVFHRKPLGPTSLQAVDAAMHIRVPVPTNTPYYTAYSTIRSSSY